jgi:hypothetical protein
MVAPDAASSRLFFLLIAPMELSFRLCLAICLHKFLLSHGSFMVYCIFGLCFLLKNTCSDMFLKYDMRKYSFVLDFKQQARLAQPLERKAHITLWSWVRAHCGCFTYFAFLLRHGVSNFLSFW